MIVVFEGVVRTRVKKRISILNGERWDSEPFRWEFDLLKDECGKYAHAAEGLDLAAERVGDRLFVKASVKGHPYVLSDSRIDEEYATSISVLSVAGMDVSGHLKHVPTFTVEAQPGFMQNTA